MSDPNMLAGAILIGALLLKRHRGGGGGGPEASEGPPPLPGAAELAAYGEHPPTPIGGVPWLYVGHGEPLSEGTRGGHLFTHPDSSGARLYDPTQGRWYVGRFYIADGKLRVRAVTSSAGSSAYNTEGELTGSERERRRAVVREIEWVNLPPAAAEDARRWWQPFHQWVPEHHRRTTRSGRVPVLTYYQPDGAPVRFLMAAQREGWWQHPAPLVLNGADIRTPGPLPGVQFAAMVGEPITREAWLWWQALGPYVPLERWTARPTLPDGATASCWGYDEATGAIWWGRSASAEDRYRTHGSTRQNPLARNGDCTGRALNVHITTAALSKEWAGRFVLGG